MSNTFALPTYSAIYAFGDSLSDSGNIWINTGVKPVSPPYYAETYSVPGNPTVTADVFSNGPTWVQDLSLSLGLGVLAPNLAGGTNYAYSGAVSGPTPENPSIQVHTLQQQALDFQAAVPNPAASALYTIDMGVNDIIDLIDNSALSLATIRAGITAAVGNEIGVINQLVTGGAKHLLILNVPDLGLFPTVTASGSTSFDAEATNAASLYNALLSSGIASIAAGGVDIKTYNTFQFYDGAVANPAAYGLIDTSTPVWSGGFSDPTGGTLISSNPLVQDQYLFFDHEHPTETGELAIAQGALTVLSGGVQCFAEGTRIDTPRGPVAVERLAIGDRVRLAGGGSAPVVWRGWRGIDCAGHPRPWDVNPVRVRAGAFGPGRPRADILLSPDHAIAAGGGLIPVRYLINGATIAQEPAGRVTYWHIELERHALILAEGLACESYLDTGNRGAFANAPGIAALHGGFAPPEARRQQAEAIWAAQACAPLIRDGEALIATRAALRRRAVALGFTTSVAPGLHLLGPDGPILPTLSHGGLHRFPLPPGTRHVTIASTSGVPAEHTPESEDRRRLGIMLTAMVLRGPGTRQDIPLASGGPGFHPIEHDGAQVWRWTDGRGGLPLPPTAGPALLDLHVATAHPSWIAPPSRMKTVATAGRPDQPRRHA